MSKIVTKSDQFQRWFISFSYDDIESGLAVCNNKIVKYWAENGPENDQDDELIKQIFVFDMTLFEKIKEIIGKKLFEVCVGKHCSYNLKTGNRIEEYFIMKNEKLVKLYYKMKKRGQ